MEIRPLYDRILVKRVESPTVSRGGIFLPESASEKPSEGEILATGQGRLADDGVIRPLAVKVGDRVLFSRYAGNEIKVDGQERLILRENEVLGIVEA